ncbi:MAG: hypothetical protein RR581_06875 [Eubacterium sp.]
MSCSRLSKQSDRLSNEFKGYLGALTLNTQNNITVQKVSKALNISATEALNILMDFKEKDVLTLRYAFRCPECGTLIKKYDSLEEIEDEIFCYVCEDEKQLDPKDIELLFGISKDEYSFNLGQQNSNASFVAPENSLTNLLQNYDNISSILYRPNEEDYKRLSDEYKSVFEDYELTTQKGDTLENLVIDLFSISKAFRAKGIRIFTNQIDCFVRNTMYVEMGILNTVGRQFVIECKNEKKVPEGTYMSKLHDIMELSNCNDVETFYKFGIICSKCHAPKTFTHLSNKYYLKNNIVMISIDCNDLKKIINEKVNLLELLDRKICEVCTNAITDLRAAGLYSG